MNAAIAGSERGNGACSTEDQIPWEVVEALLADDEDDELLPSLGLELQEPDYVSTLPHTVELESLFKDLPSTHGGELDPLPFLPGYVDPPTPNLGVLSTSPVSIMDTFSEAQTEPLKKARPRRKATPPPTTKCQNRPFEPLQCDRSHTPSAEIEEKARSIDLSARRAKQVHMAKVAQNVFKAVEVANASVLKAVRLMHNHELERRRLAADAAAALAAASRAARAAPPLVAYRKKSKKERRAEKRKQMCL